GGVAEHAALAEQVGHRAAGAEIAAALGEGVPHLAGRAVAVVGHAIDHHRHPAGAVALVAHLLELLAARLAGAAPDRALDGVLGHVGRQRRVDGGAQARIGGRVPAAGASGHGDLAYEFGEQPAALGVLRVLAVLDVGPFTVAGHERTPRQSN